MTNLLVIIIYSIFLVSRKLSLYSKFDLVLYSQSLRGLAPLSNLLFLLNILQTLLLCFIPTSNLNIIEAGLYSLPLYIHSLLMKVIEV